MGIRAIGMEIMCKEKGAARKRPLAEATGFRGVDYFYTIGLGNKDGINADTLKNLSEKVWENNKNCVFSDEKKPYLCGNLTALKSGLYRDGRQHNQTGVYGCEYPGYAQ